MRRSWNKVFTRRKVGLILIFIGITSFLVAVFLKEYQGNPLSFSQAPEPVNIVEEGDLPEKILISKVGIDLPVLPTEVIDGSWEVSDEGASYLLGSGIPGREGNVIIYSHNKNHLFGPIRWLGEDDEIRLINKKGDEFIYRIKETKTVSPETIEVLSPTEEATLTLYTCAGFLDRERFVVVAKLQLE